MPTHANTARIVKRSIQDHPECSAYLAGRHILEQAIEAGARIEYNDYYGRNCLVWHEKREDGSPGARRRRFIDLPLINGSKAGNCIWFPGEKTDERFHYRGSLNELKQAVADADGAINIEEGEVDVWSMNAMGYSNTIGTYGINQIKCDHAIFLRDIGVTGVRYHADADDADEKGATNMRPAVADILWDVKQTYFKFDIPGVKDANDLLCKYHADPLRAREALASLPAYTPS